MRIEFLGTGASGGTPGSGRSHRRESSAVVSRGGTSILIDVTRYFGEQRERIERPPDAALLTHAHRDASGGLAALDRWLRGRGSAPLRTYASPETIAAAHQRFLRLESIEFVAVGERRRRRIGGLTVTPITVPHARERRFPTYAWRISAGGVRLAYASDVARLTPKLRQFAGGAKVLVIDAAMWGRSLFSHLTIDRELPRLCGWRVERILLTQIGRSVPEHRRLVREARRLCPKALPAYDGLQVELA